MGLSFEPERTWTEQAIAELGQRVITCFLVPGKARDICARYRDEAGTEHDIVISCVPHMTPDSVREELRRAMAVI